MCHSFNSRGFRFTLKQFSKVHFFFFFNQKRRRLFLVFVNLSRFRILESRNYFWRRNFLGREQRRERGSKVDVTRTFPEYGSTWSWPALFKSDFFSWEVFGAGKNFPDFVTKMRWIEILLRRLLHHRRRRRRRRRRLHRRGVFDLFCRSYFFPDLNRLQRKKMWSKTPFRSVRFD